VGALWDGDELGADHSVPRVAGFSGGRLAALYAGGAVGRVSAGEARFGDDALRRRRAFGADPGADTRRLAHRQLLLALDLLYQHSDRRFGARRLLCRPRRSPVSEAGARGTPEKAAAVRRTGAQLPDDPHGLLGNCAQQRGAVGLAGGSVLANPD